MRFALAVAALLLTGGSAIATEDYTYINRGKHYGVSLDRGAQSRTIDGEKPNVEHMDWSSADVEVRGIVSLGNIFYWAELNNMASIVWMRHQIITRVDQCRSIDKPPT